MNNLLVRCKLCDWVEKLTSFDFCKTSYRKVIGNETIKYHCNSCNNECQLNDSVWFDEMSDEFKNCNSLSSSNVSISDADDNGERLPDPEIDHADEPDFWNN